MKRDIEQHLLEWKESPIRAPLLIRGARQVGKSWIVENFGKTHFPTTVIINFEQRPEMSSCFETLIPHKIISSIELLTGFSIIPGKTLLFLDEIQNCPQAIVSLRYFKEQMPSLHVVGAGSLLEFSLSEENFSMPVGRVQFLYLRPLSFYEFLNAIGRENLREYLHTVTLENHPSPTLHAELLSLVREYIALGGMPAVIAAYLQKKSLYQAQNIQSDILTTYRQDFGKYATKAQYTHLSLLFEKAPGLIGAWFKYSKVDPDVHSRDIKVALQKLSYAGLIYQVHHTSACELPLVTTQSEKKFKLLFLDVGLAKRACYLDMSLIFNEDILLVNQGLLTEQFVGQEILAHTNPRDHERLFFWAREKKNSNAEVDFVTAVGSMIVPIQVKAGKIGRLKSLKLFMEEKQSLIGIRISSLPLSIEDCILSLPFYMIGELERLILNR